MSTTSVVLIAVFGLIAAVAAVFFPFALASALRDKRNSATTIGTVTRIESVHEGWVAHIDYEVDGARHSVGVGSNGGYAIGEPVRLRYVRDDPSRAFLDSGGIWMEAIAALVLAAAFGGAAGVILLLARAGIM